MDRSAVVASGGKQEPNWTGLNGGRETARVEVRWGGKLAFSPDGQYLACDLGVNERREIHLL